jgi:hypothetical protein
MKYHKRLPWLIALCDHDCGFEYVGALKTGKINHPFSISIDLDIYRCTFCGKFKAFGLFKNSAPCLVKELLVSTDDA